MSTQADRTAARIRERAGAIVGVSLALFIATSGAAWSVSAAPSVPVAADTEPTPQSEPTPDPEPASEPASEPAEPAAEPEAPAPEPEADPETKTEPQPAAPSPVPLPSLDELLDLVPPKDGEAPGRPEMSPGPEREALDRALTGEREGDNFTIAARRMGEVADRLVQMNDADLIAVRMQDEILARLDQAIEQAEQQQQQSSSSGQQQPQDQDQQQQQDQQQSSQQQQQQQQQESDGEGDAENAPPGARDPRTSAMLDAAQAAWGNLPERVRQTLLEGVDERFSDLYQSLTEQYYRRLAGDDTDGARE